MDEVWQEIKNFEGLYEVSNKGRVRSLTRIQPHPRYHGRHRKFTGRILKATSDKDGYSLVSLWKNGKRYSGKVHRLVAYAFIKNQKNLEQVNHKNGIKNDNRVENLEWVTSQENQQHALKMNLRPTRRICDQYGNVYNSTQEAARTLCLQQSNVWKVLHGDINHSGGYIFRDFKED